MSYIEEKINTLSPDDIDAINTLYQIKYIEYFIDIKIYGEKIFFEKQTLNKLRQKWYNLEGNNAKIAIEYNKLYPGGYNIKNLWI